MEGTKRENTPGKTLGSFANRRVGTGTTALYGASAISMLAGMAVVMQPILGRGGDFKGSLLCLLFLYSYTLALVGGAWLVFHARRAAQDAMWLGGLSAIFMVASGITLDTLAVDMPKVALGLGSGVLLISFGAIWILQQRLGIPFGKWILGAVGVLLTWNYLSGPWLCYLHSTASPQFTPAWQIGWRAVFFSMLLLWGQSVVGATTAQKKNCKTVPFLHQPGMAWTFAFLLLLGCNAHHYALAYVFDQTLPGIMFVPFLGILAFTSVNLLYKYGLLNDFGRRWGTLVPLGLFLSAWLVTKVGFPLPLTKTAHGIPHAG